MEDITKDPKIKQWYSILELSENTQKLYSLIMKQFCECVGKNPTELIKEAETEIKKGLLPSERKIVEDIVKYKNYLKEKNAAPKTQSTSMAAIKSFFRVFDITLPNSTGKIKHAIPLEEHMGFLTKEEVQSLIVNANNLRDKAIIMLMATSGMARNEIINLRIKNIVFDPSGIGIIKIRRQKTKIDYTTFCSTEAVTALKTYFEERNRIPQNVSPNRTMALDKLKVRGENDYVFVDYKYATKLEFTAFSSIFRREGDKMGFFNGKGKYRKSRSHSLRKFFASTLENAGMPHLKVDYMLGHARSGNDMAYFNQDIEVLKKLYIDYLQHITFERDVHIHSIRTEDGKRLEELNEQLEQKDTIIQSLQQRMDAFEGNYEYFQEYLKDFYESHKPPGLKPVKRKELKDLQKPRALSKGNEQGRGAG